MKDGTNIYIVKEHAECDRKKRKDQIQELQNRLDRNKQEHEESVTELTAIIEEMKQKIADRIANSQ